MRWRVTTKDRECAIDVTREAVGIGMCSQLFSGSGWEIEARPSEEDSQQTVVVEIYRSAPPKDVCALPWERWKAFFLVNEE